MEVYFCGVGRIQFIGSCWIEGFIFLLIIGRRCFEFQLYGFFFWVFFIRVFIGEELERKCRRERFLYDQVLKEFYFYDLIIGVIFILFVILCLLEESYWVSFTFKGRGRGMYIRGWGLLGVMLGVIYFDFFFLKCRRYGVVIRLSDMIYMNVYYFSMKYLEFNRL